MQLRTILNRVYKLPGFVYGKIRLVEREDGQAEVEVEVVPRANGQARCSGYDRRERRRYEFVPVLGLPTYFSYQMRRVDCRRCGKVKVERVPWAEGKQRSTKALSWFLASWAKRLSWQETAQPDFVTFVLDSANFRGFRRESPMNPGRPGWPGAV